ncbi:hypothetical protein UFOVP122_69 [uncultured Caudovirales phage]|uniref:Uncharacterized protein n=1 Tax=uncultured Caudovirales phage TaxID=2100421 RepID=A0A6J5LB47_9CAUD|nr:hypothetical protein UFOVP122_69 [uncultured Caudovirales phage]
MTDDLMKRLRARITHSDSGKTSWPDALCYEAADRIEKLEAALIEIIYDGWLDGYDVEKRARKALEGEDD